MHSLVDVGRNSTRLLQTKPEDGLQLLALLGLVPIYNFFEKVNER